MSQVRRTGNVDDSYQANNQYGQKSKSKHDASLHVSYRACQDGHLEFGIVPIPRKNVRNNSGDYI